MRLGLPASSKSKPFILEQLKDVFRLWVMYNSDLSRGSFYEIQHGICHFVTIHPDDTESRQLIS